MTSLLAPICAASILLASPALAYRVDIETPRAEHPHFRPVIELSQMTRAEVCRLILKESQDLISAVHVPAPIDR